MSVTEIKHALGSWSLDLRDDTPRIVLDALEPFGHLAVAPGRINPAEVGDNLLSAARYVGVYRGMSSGGSYSLKGVGMAFWLGDEDGKGDVLTTAVTLSGATFPNTMRALLPPGGAVVEGTLHSVPGTYTGTHQWETPRRAITYVCDTMSTSTYPVSWRVNGDGTLDAGRDVDMFVTDPTALLVRRDPGRELRIVGLSGNMRTDVDVEDYTTSVVLLAEGDGLTVSMGTASQATGYKDLHGNTLTMTRLVSESNTDTTNAAARAQLQLNRFVNPRRAVTLSSDSYDVRGEFVVGDTIMVYDPDAGFVDTNRQVTWCGQPISPIALKVSELTWPIPDGWTVAFRCPNGTWIDLSAFYVPESGSTSIKVGDFSSSLSGLGGEPIGNRLASDSSTPATPTLGTPSSAAYQSAAANDVRAAVYLTWSQPLNTDGSTILDGDHYEVRYRTTQTFSYPITWSQSHTFTWDELQSWGRPLSNPAAVAAQWVTAFVGWGTEELTINELMVSAEYEFQIRAVDGQAPPNQSAWSASTFHTTRADTLAPATPAAPVVTSSLIALQVTHSLGLSSGGTFNLPDDLHHLEVHAGGPEFFPDSSSQIGSLVANSGHLAARVAVVGTFQVPHTADVWVKVVAVDRFGNRSSPSSATQATPGLIDSQHISDLTASKITAGTIGADLLLAASIRTADTGQRAELNQAGLQLYDADGELTINLTADDAVTNFITINDGGRTLAAITDAGAASFQSLAVSSDNIEVNGQQLFDLLARAKEPYLAYGYLDTTSGSTTGSIGIFEIEFNAPADGLYLVDAYFNGFSTVASDEVACIVRDGGASTPTTSSAQVASGGHAAGKAYGGETWMCHDVVHFTAGPHRLLVCATMVWGTGTLGINGRAFLAVGQFSNSLPNLAVANSGSGGGGGVTPVQTRTATWGASWSGSYDGSNGFVSYYNNDAHQGYYSTNQRSLIGFDSASITSTLAGATILGCSVILTNFHWYYNSGGTAVIGTHGHSSRPGSFSAWPNRIQSGGWPRGGTRLVDLGVGIGQEFQSGSTRGIALGPGPDNSYTYYGKFYGAGSGAPPVLSVTYVK